MLLTGDDGASGYSEVQLASIKARLDSRARSYNSYVAPRTAYYRFNKPLACKQAIKYRIPARIHKARCAKPINKSNRPNVNKRRTTKVKPSSSSASDSDGESSIANTVNAGAS